MCIGVSARMASTKAAVVIAVNAMLVLLVTSLPAHQISKPASVLKLAVLDRCQSTLVTVSSPRVPECRSSRPLRTEYGVQANSELSRGRDSAVIRCFGSFKELTRNGIDSACLLNLYQVFLLCNNTRLRLDIDALTFLPWICPQMEGSVSMDEVVTNWNFKPSSCLQENDSMTLTRPSNMSEELMLEFNVTSLTTKLSPNSFRYALLSNLNVQIYHGVLYDFYQHDTNIEVKLSQTKWKRATPVMASGYIIVANHLYLHHISLDGSRTKVAVSGLDYAVALDYHFSNSSVYWSDYMSRSIMKASLDGLKKSTLLDHGLTQPESLSVDWINNKLYWTDVRERVIGVLDVITKIYKTSLISTELDQVDPRGLAVDPTTRTLYWTEWGESQNARIRKASMDGDNNMTLFQDNLRRPIAITIDFNNQLIYWVDSYLDKIECARVSGTGRRVIISSGIQEPFDITLLGDILYISDINLGILATNKSGDQPVNTIYNTFCVSVNPFGLQAVAQERQLQMSNPCDANGNGGCSHLCLLSSTDSRGYSCACPDEMNLDETGLTCTQVSTSPTNNPAVSGVIVDSCIEAGYRGCCNTGTCEVSSAGCFCDSKCYRFGDCCNDIEDTCSPQNESNGYLLVSSVLYIHRLSFDGARTKALHSSSDPIRAVDYDYRKQRIYWSTSNQNGLWQSQFDGSIPTLLLQDNIQTVDDIAVDWITNKLYWTDSGLVDRIRVLDTASGHHTTVVYTGANTSPRAIVVDPVRRWLYWTDWGNVPKIEKSSMDGRNRTVLHSANLIQPSGLTLDHTAQLLYWTDRREGKLESSGLDGSNRRIVHNTDIYQPFGISVYRGTLYFTDLLTGVNTFTSVNDGEVDIILDSNKICEDAIGIEVVNLERQPTGVNPCQVDNGGCSHLCLLSSIQVSGYSCACPEGLNLDSDGQTCLLPGNGTAPPVTQSPVAMPGTCAAAGYTGGCCTSGTCQGSPPTCSCDSPCHLFRDCCSDVHPSCQPDVDVLEFVTVPSNATLVLGHQDGSHQIQFHCSVRASRVTNFEWTFANASHISASAAHQITDAVGSLDAKYLVLSSEYSSSLIVEAVQFSDAGVYTCTASIGDSVSRIQASAFYAIEVLPNVPEVVGNHLVSDKETIHLLCRVEAYPQPSIVWLFRSSTVTRVLLTTSRTSISQNNLEIENGNPYWSSELVINSVDSTDSGDYLCIVSTDSNRDSPNKIRVHSVTVTSIYHCEYHQQLCLNGATCIDNNGKYYCVCTSQYQGQNCSQRVQNTSPLTHPRFVTTQASVVNVNLGNSVNLTYVIEGHPPPSFEWYRDGVLIPGETQSFLYIPEVISRDRGNYTCKAMNREGIAESDPTHLKIPGVLQYVATLECNESVITEENLANLFNPSLITEDISLYSLEYLSNWTQTVLVTVVQIPRERITSSETKTALSSLLKDVCNVHTVTRFDGCEVTESTEIDLGENIGSPCPCHEHLQNVPEVEDQEGWRYCGGSYTNGANLSAVDWSQCTTVVRDITHGLCDAVVSVIQNPLKSLDLAINVTSDHQLSSIADIALLSILIEVLVDESIRNLMVTENHLKIIDYFQMLDPQILFACQAVTNSSTRVLKSLEQIASRVSVSPNSSDDTMIMYTYQSYGIALVDVSTSKFRGQTFIARRRRKEDPINMNATEWNNNNNIMVIENGSTKISTMDDFVAQIYLPDQVVKECTADIKSTSNVSDDVQRVAYFVFYTNVLFQTESDKVGLTIASVRLDCNSIEQVSTPIQVTFNKTIDETNREQICGSWMEGTWSSVTCQTSRETGTGLIKCEYHQLSYFGLLLKSVSSAITITIYTYICIALSLLFLAVVLAFTLVARYFISFEGLIIVHMILALMLKYSVFLLGTTATSNPVLCGVCSGLLHFITLSFFSSAAVHSLFLFISYYGLSKQSKKSLNMCSYLLLLWGLPLVTVILTAAVGHKYYSNSYFCGVVESPLWFGLILPLGIICIVHFIINILLVIKAISTNSSKQSNNSTSSNKDNESIDSQLSTSNVKSKRQKLTAIVLVNIMYILFYIELLFELLSTNLRLANFSTSFQVPFALLTVTKGPLLFVYVFCCVPRVRKLWCRWRCFVRTCFIDETDSIPGIEEQSCATGSSSLSSSKWTVDETEGRDSKSMAIATETNQAYEAVIAIRRRDAKADQYDMTDNPLYAQLAL